ncbi:hypothetical protein OEB99_02220 [Actinotalea sp. M2MS4P-6]|uniref:hypothetical protein n=1 Tax=Actinotalea sp. M2MS4P-6 TaxID=2983762 RepID=UPI0021E3B011|nr:hypothetical protein [Actinotalea sp. M2MS4P-6]MCV2393114.1 hypothetical protein [Actinotalea sp. M2MS4P-6]
MPRLLRLAMVLAGLGLALVGAVWVSLEQSWGHQIVAPPYGDFVVGQTDGAMSVTGALGDVWVEPADGDTWVVLRSVEGTDPEELFRGAQEDAQLYAETEARVVVVEGDRAEVEAWIADHERGPQLFGPIVLLAAGTAIVLAGLFAGRHRTTVHAA